MIFNNCYTFAVDRKIYIIVREIQKKNSGVYRGCRIREEESIEMAEREMEVKTFDLKYQQVGANLNLPPPPRVLFYNSNSPPTWAPPHL